MLARGLARIRRQQQALTRVVLALFCLAWLQAAAMPCAMATGAGLPTAAEHLCPYCPPQPETPPCHDDGPPVGCTYPDSPQVDLRGSLAAGAIAPLALLTPLEVLPVALAPDARDIDERPTPARTSLAISYCRFLE